jgi:hypothetical protein
VLIEVHAFRDLADAAKWLAIPVDVLTLKDWPVPHIGASRQLVSGLPTTRRFSGKREIDVDRGRLMFEKDNVVGVTKHWCNLASAKSRTLSLPCKE